MKSNTFFSELIPVNKHEQSLLLIYLVFFCDVFEELDDGGIGRH